MARAVGSTPYARSGRPRRPRWLVVVFVLLLVVPILEIATIIAVGRTIGGWETVFLLLIESALGAWLVRREGARAWSALNTALRTGQMPSRELSDAALVLVGGTLLLTPGFLTDIVGFFFILPFSRPIARTLLEAAVAKRLLGGFAAGGGVAPVARVRQDRMSSRARSSDVAPPRTNDGRSPSGVRPSLLESVFFDPGAGGLRRCACGAASRPATRAGASGAPPGALRARGWTVAPAACPSGCGRA